MDFVSGFTGKVKLVLPTGGSDFATAISVIKKQPIQFSVVLCVFGSFTYAAPLAGGRADGGFVSQAFELTRRNQQVAIFMGKFNRPLPLLLVASLLIALIFQPFD